MRHTFSDTIPIDFEPIKTHQSLLPQIIRRGLRPTTPPTSLFILIKNLLAMKGMQKQAKFARGMGQPGQPGAGESTGIEVQPVQVLMGAVGFIITVVLLHFYSKITA